MKICRFLAWASALAAPGLPGAYKFPRQPNSSSSGALTQSLVAEGEGLPGAYKFPRQPNSSSSKSRAVISSSFENFIIQDPVDREVLGAQKTEAVWGTASHLSRLTQLLFASAWICLLGCVPFYIKWVAGGSRPVTRCETFLAAFLWVTLFGAVYLFTQVLVFDSLHFKQPQSLTLIECIYLMAQILTTVGYGDIMPATQAGQFVITVVTVGALLLASVVMTLLADHVREVAKTTAQQLRTNAEAVSLTKGEDDRRFADGERPMPDPSDLVSSLLIFISLEACWILFFWRWPGEKKNIFQATYMSITTFSTVGFNSYTPQTETGMIFSAFFMLFGSAALVNFIRCMAEFFVQWQEIESYDSQEPECAVKHVDETKAGRQDVVSEVDFLRFALLSQNLVEEVEIDRILSTFRKLKPEGATDASIPIQALEEAVNSCTRS